MGPLAMRPCTIRAKIIRYTSKIIGENVKKQAQGLMLIEAIIFIVVIGIITFSILRQLELVTRNSFTIQNQTIATEVANRCTQWFIGNRYMNGYSAIACPSTTVPSFCVAPTGYTVAVNVTCTTLYSSASYKTATVTVSGKGSATSSVILADY